MAEPPPEERERRYRVVGNVLRHDPSLIEKSFFEALSRQIAERITLEEYEEKSVSRTVNIVIGEVGSKTALPVLKDIIVDMVLKNVTSTFLGQVIPVTEGLSVFLDRVLQVAKILRVSYREAVKKTLEIVRDPYARAEDKRNAILTLMKIRKAVYLALHEAIIRLLALQSINLPPELAPNIVNLRKGYEIIYRTITRREVPPTR